VIDRLVLSLGLLALLPGRAAAGAMEMVVLRALNKISARVSMLEIKVGDTATFGNLEITVRHCDKRPPEEPPESAAFLEIVETPPTEVPVSRFFGWMFASSPGLSAMEHPIYDVWVLDCKNASTSESETAP